jgi:hypothetical protein
MILLRISTIPANISRGVQERSSQKFGPKFLKRTSFCLSSKTFLPRQRGEDINMSLYSSIVVDPFATLPIGSTVQIPVPGGGTIEAPILPSSYASALTPYSMYMPVYKGEQGYTQVASAAIAEEY